MDEHMFACGSDGRRVGEARRRLDKGGDQSRNQEGGLDVDFAHTAARVARRRDAAEECAELDATHPTGTACKNHYTAGGSDPNFAAINATGPKVANVINGIHQRAPQARVLIVGYPDGLPTNGTSCWPLVPISAGDIKYFNSLEQGLNQVEASVAAANGATFVDTWDSSIGHDACKAPGVARVNGIVPTSAAFPLHPNQAGEANMARQVLATFG